MGQPVEACHRLSPCYPSRMRMQHLWAPWRLQYLENLTEAAKVVAPAPDTPHAGPTSFLDEYWANPGDDESNGVVWRDDRGMIVLNRYPYSNGHLLAVLGNGRPRLLDYDASDRAHLWRLVDYATDLVERTLECQGVNIGINQGRAAGAGVPHHLHVHILPRWAGDTNFITVVGEIRVVPQSLEVMYERFAATVAAHPAPSSA